MDDAFFITSDGEWFTPTDNSRGPWDADTCHAGPPAALMVRATERLVPDQRLARIAVDLMRPIPMAPFRVAAEVRRAGRSVTLTEIWLGDADTVYAVARGMHLRRAEIEVPTASVPGPDLAVATQGTFPIRSTVHGLPAIVDAIEVRYDPRASQGDGGHTIVWMRTKVPLLADEEPSPFQRICPLADSGNGISYNDYLDRVLFVNPDLHLSLHRDPVGEWFCSDVVSHWHGDGTGMADATLFDVHGPVGRAVQHLLLMPASSQ
jgi:hypothetical protein